jgi:hypothetical protein
MVYIDVDWAGCSDTRWSTSGYAMFLDTNLISWSSKRQNIISHSSAEAEYQAVANGMVDACWLWQLLQEFHAPLVKSTLVYYDNVSAVYLSSNPIQHHHMSTSSQFIDIFTKGLPTLVFSEFQSNLNIHND